MTDAEVRDDFLVQHFGALISVDYFSGMLIYCIGFMVGEAYGTAVSTWRCDN